VGSSTPWGIDELRERNLQGAQVPPPLLRPIRVVWPRHRCQHLGDAPAGIGTAGPPPTAVRAAAGRPRPVDFRRAESAPALGTSPTVRAAGRANGTVSAYAYGASLGDITTEQFPRPSPTSSATSAWRCASRNRQNFVLRGLTEEQLPPRWHERLDAIGMAEARRRAGARPSCRAPGGRHLQTSRFTQSRGLAADIGSAPRRPPGSPRSAGWRVNISGCTNSCGTAPHLRQSASSASSAACPRPEPHPGTTCCSVGHVGEMEIEFSATRRSSCPPSEHRKPWYGVRGPVSPAKRTAG